MKVKVELLQLRKARAWSQDELATASGLNLRTIQRIENEASSSLQCMKAPASTFKVNIRALEHEEAEMIDELVGKKVTIVTSYIGVVHTLKGEVVEIQAQWLKLMRKNKPVYINLNRIVQAAPE